MANDTDSFVSPDAAELASASLVRDRMRALPSFPASASASAADSAEEEGLEASSPAGIGGLGRSGSGFSGSVAITHCERVVVVHEDVDNTSDCTLCGVEIGQTGKLCFKEGCSTNSHVQARGKSSFWLKQGIYIRSGVTGAASKKVHLSPIGSLDIFNIHHEEIVGISDTTPALWTARFNTWEQESDPDNSSFSSEESQHTPAFGRCMHCNAIGYELTPCSECDDIFHPIKDSSPIVDSPGIHEDYEEHDPALRQVRRAFMASFGHNPTDNDVRDFMASLGPHRSGSSYNIPSVEFEEDREHVRAASAPDDNPQVVMEKES